MSLQNQQTILLTNLFLASRTGSELHIIELAGYFTSKGWDVTIYTLSYAYPLQKESEKIGAKVVVFGNEHQLQKHYDVLYAQHKRVSEYLAAIPGLTFDRVIVSVLGIVTEEEALPYFTKDADAVVFVSDEAKDHFKSNEALLNKKKFVFPNTAASEYFDAFDQARSENLISTSNDEGVMDIAAAFPRRIAVISNHMPLELQDLATIVAEKNAQTVIDFYGYESVSVEITPALIKSYDLIISIGRTAQLALAAGTPYYCYDIFGGPGFIEPKDMARHAYHNFSGRSEPTKRSGDELYADISLRFRGAVQQLDANRRYAKDNFSFDSKTDELHNIVCSIEPRTRSLANDMAAALIEIYRNRCIEFQQMDEQHYGRAQIFYSLDSQIKDPTEERSFKFKYRYNNRIVITADEIGFPDASFIRFDPDEAYSVCSYDQDLVTTSNAAALLDGDYYFISTDPMLYLKEDTTHIDFVCKEMDAKASVRLSNYIQHLENSLRELYTSHTINNCSALNRLKHRVRAAFGNR